MYLFYDFLILSFYFDLIFYQIGLSDFRNGGTYFYIRACL